MLNENAEQDLHVNPAEERTNKHKAGLLAVRYREIPNALKRLGYDKLRPGQHPVVCNILKGRDTICILPTSGGKTATHIIPTLVCGWRTLVFSPLVSLMKDQVESLQRFGLSAGQINSSQMTVENSMIKASWEAGELQYLFVAPERLAKDDFQKLMRRVRPDMVVVDEAHCVSSWGHSFRPAYARIAEFIDDIKPDVVLALTATVTDTVERDMRVVLGMQQADRFVYLPRRTNLVLSSVEMPETDNRDKTAMSRVNGELLRRLNDIDGATIVYTSSVKMAEELQAQLGPRINGGAAVYHGRLQPSEKDAVQDQFMGDRIKVMFATNAFGMGVDKPNIRGIVHRHPPASVEALSQEIGRAGRDGLESQCILMADPAGFRINSYFLEGNYPQRDVIERVFDYLRKRASAAPIYQTVVEIGLALGFHERDSHKVGAAINILDKHKVLERKGDDSKACGIRVLGTTEDPDFLRIVNAATRFGRADQNGFHRVDLAVLVQESHRTLGTMQSWLREMVKLKVIDYEAPFRGKSTRVIGDLTVVDFEDLAERRAHAAQNIDDVWSYIRTPDHQKHSFLERYFHLEGAHADA